MLHEVLGKNINVEDCEEDFSTIYEKGYFPKELMDEIKEANVLLIPNYIIKDKKEAYVFPENTQEFLEYLRDNASDTFKPDIAIDDDGFHKLELHSATITITSLIVKKIVYPIALGLITNFLYDQVKKMHRDKENVSAKVNIIVTEEGKKSKRISYEGPVSSVEEALISATKEIFNDSTGD